MNALTVYSVFFLFFAIYGAESRITLVTGNFDERTHDVHKRAVAKPQTKPLKQPKIYNYIITSDVRYRYCTTVLSSKMGNTESTSQEVTFSVTLPESAFISEFLMIIKDKTYKAYVKEKEEAKKIYEDAKSAGRTAAHVQQNVRDSNVFDVSVNIEPQGKVTFNLTYEQLLERVLGLYENIIHINPGQIVEDLAIDISIQESSGVGLLISEFKTYNQVSEFKKSLEEDSTIETSNEDGKEKIKWYPTAEQQSRIQEEGLSGQFVVRYDINRTPESNEILVDEGYFVHFFAPTDLPVLPKHVIFVLDTSGSMQGRSLQQLQEAMYSILGEMKPDDYLSIILFATDVKVWTITDSNRQKTSLAPATKDNLEKAKKYVESLRAYGSTNIIDALEKSLNLADEIEQVEKSLESIIFFLTDGLPNVKERNTENIIKAITAHNKKRTPLFSLALGPGADYNFLRKLSLLNGGFARRIYVAADTNLQLKNFYRQISSPLLSNVTFTYVPGQVDENSVTKSSFSAYFLGGELVVAGKIKDGYQYVPGSNEIKATAETNSKGCWRCPVPVPTINVPANHSQGHLERLWAHIYIKQLLDEYLKTENATYKEKALALSLKYSFVTPLTSLVVVKPNETVATEPLGTVPRPVAGVPLVYAKRGHQSPSAARTGGGRDSYDDARIIGGVPQPTLKELPSFEQGPITSFPLPESDKTIKNFTLNDVQWLSPGQDSLKLPSSDAKYQIHTSRNDTKYETCNSPKKVSSHCRHMEFCILPEFLQKYENYVPFSCVIENTFAGVCCPDEIL